MINEQLGRRDIQVLSRFLRDKVCLSKRFNPKLRAWLMDSFGDLCRSDGDELVFSADSKRRLLIELNSLYSGMDWLAGLQADQTRCEIVASVKDDKLANIKPDDGYVLLRTLGLSEQCLGLDASLPAYVSLRLPVRRLNITDLRWIVIVENLDIFDQMHQCRLPPCFDNALLVYRGHNANGLKELLAMIRTDTQVAYFADLDPKGLEIALSTPAVTHLLVPFTLEPKLLERSQTSKFLAQHTSVSYLKRQQWGGWQPWIDRILEARLAIMQQHILQLDIPLIELAK